jgi:cytochrome c oxidase cbb3-type subunit 3
MHWLKLPCFSPPYEERDEIRGCRAAKSPTSPSIPSFIRRGNPNNAKLGCYLILLILLFLAGCNSLPGKPTEEHRWVTPTRITDFDKLYSANCAGCHGSDGRLGAAIPLNNSLYLTLVNQETLHEVIAQGVSGTSMPPFGLDFGGALSDKQIDAIISGMQKRWGRPEQFKDVILPPYRSSSPGDPQRGAVAFKTYCAQCHGEDGSGGQKKISVIDPNYLALVSDQSLRTIVIVGRSDLAKPDWRSNLSGKPMSADEISDVVAWMISHRQTDGR